MSGESDMHMEVMNVNRDSKESQILWDKGWLGCEYFNSGLEHSIAVRGGLGQRAIFALSSLPQFCRKFVGIIF